MDLTLKAEQVSVVSTKNGYGSMVELEITGVDRHYLDTSEVGKVISLDNSLSNKTEDEVKSWVCGEMDWPLQLLENFWQSKSDACPLEESEMNAQITAFESYVRSLS